MKAALWPDGLGNAGLLLAKRCADAVGSADMFGRHVKSPRRPYWLFVILWLITLTLYLVLWIIDAWPYGAKLPPLLFPNVSTGASLQGLAEVTVAVLAMAITVVSILVELAATRYTPRITTVFLRDRTNAVVLSFFVVVTLFVVWVTFTLDSGEIYPGTSALVLAAQVLISASLLMLLPYFAYVFQFLQPTRVVGTMAELVASHLDRVARGTVRPRQARARVSDSMEYLGDIALKAIQHKDKAIAIAAVSNLSTVMTHHLHLKRQLPDAWFASDLLVYEDSDFVSFQQETVEEMAEQRTWLTMKGMLQYMAGFIDALNNSREIAHLIAIRTRQITRRAAELDDRGELVLGVRFINSYMRAAINTGDVRTAYNLLNEYRLLCTALLSTPQRDMVIEVALRIKQYGQLGFRQNMGFILETAAYDLAYLIESLGPAGQDMHDSLLDILLDVDREPDEGILQQERSLRGVRKAQIKLAAWYLSHGDNERARRIFEDMRHEQVARLDSIRAELEAATDPFFWEISDRVRNFNYVEPERRPHMVTFFGWFQNWVIQIEAKTGEAEPPDV